MRQREQHAVDPNKYAGKGVVGFTCGCIHANNATVRYCIKHAPEQRSLSGRYRRLGDIVDGRVNRHTEKE